MSINDNIRKIRDQIGLAAEASGRKSEDILLVAATKTQDAKDIKEAIAGGVDACGENRVQELVEKYPQGAYEGVPIHFIGHLQKNKLKKVVGVADIIESVDSLSLLAEIEKRAYEIEIVQDVLVQVNIGSDPAKFGISSDAVLNLLENTENFRNIKVRGLMTILPISPIETKNRQYFYNMYKLFVDIKAKRYDNVSMDYLSMGMSGDFCQAILEGANMVRIGSSIFGLRN